MKAPATRTAKSTKTAPPAVKGRASQAKTKAVVVARPAPKTPARPVAKAAAKPAAKPMAKSAAKPAPVSKAPAKKATPAKKPVVTKSTPVKPVPKVAPKTTAKAVPKASVQPVKPVAKPAPKTPVKPVAKALPPVKPAAKAPAKAVTPSAPAAVPKPVAASPASGARRQAAPAPIVVEPTPRPLGKRAAKKVMMEQMTQAAVVPTHAPDAAKATFFTMNERVMTPPVPSSIQKDPKRANNWKTLPLEQLTDQDVQAMPDGEYMNDVQMAFFRRKLSLLKADMLANAGETTEHLREDTVVVPDPADRATIEEEHALELRTRDRERKLLKKIEQAIARIDSGDYGYCEETGEAIGVGRLMARPTASLSLEAQQRRELKQKMFGD